MKFRFVLLISSLLLIKPSEQNQNLCGDISPDPIFVHDPADCSRYLFCRRDETDPTVIISVHQLSCLSRSGNDHFDPANLLCQSDSTLCADPLCEPNTLVAVHSDETCQRYFLCELPGLILTCSGNLVFNRNTGQCVEESLAPCLVEVPPPECPRDEVLGFAPGQFPGSRCYDFIICNAAGDILFEGTCAEGQRFKPGATLLESGACVPDTTCVQSTANLFMPPTARARNEHESLPFVKSNRQNFEQ